MNHRAEIPPQIPAAGMADAGSPVHWMRVIDPVRRNKRKAAWIVLRIRTIPPARNRYQGDGTAAEIGVESLL